MSDYISREAFIADCEGRYCAPCKEQGKDANGVRCRACWVDDMLSEVMDAPAADVEPVRHSRWVIDDCDSGDEGYQAYIDVHCQKCGFATGIESGQYGWTYGDPFPWEYCPNCAAKMDLSEGRNEP